MPIAHQTKLYAIAQMKISKLTADPAGGAATYAASQLVPGVKKLAVSGSVATKTLRGDNTLLDADSTIDGLSAVIDYAKVNTDVLSILTGGAVTDTGVTPNQVSTFKLLGGSTAPSLPNYFKIEAKAVDTDYVVGDCHIVIWKCKLSTFPMLGFNEEDYQLFNFGIQAMPLVATGGWLDVVYNESSVALV